MVMNGDVGKILSKKGNEFVILIIIKKLITHSRIFIKLN